MTPPPADAAGRALLAAQDRAEALFARAVALGLLRPGVSEAALSEEIHALARAEFGVRRHWHQRVVRSGPNTVLGYGEPAADRVLRHDDILFLDFGPVFDGFEADLGRSYVLGGDPAKHRLAADLTETFAMARRFYAESAARTAGEMYDFAVAAAHARGWHFGATSAGHLVGRFPHEVARADESRFSIESGNRQRLDEPDEHGQPRHWILELHFLEPQRCWGGFVEELLTVARPG